MNPLDMVAVYATVAMLGATIGVILLAAFRRPHCRTCAEGEPPIPAQLDRDDVMVAVIARSAVRPCVKLRQYHAHAARLRAGAQQAAPKGRPLTGGAELAERERTQFDALKARRRGVRS